MEPDPCQQTILVLLAEINALRRQLQAEYQKLEAVERALVISQAYARSLKQLPRESSDRLG
jgi:capsule polysaccharide export protein KpsE/RkpR